MAYRFEQFQRAHLREALCFDQAKQAGEPLPDFDLPTTRGGRARKADYAGSRPVLISLASLTDPVAASAAPVLHKLYQEFGDDVAFLTLYVREAHPGDHVRQPRDMRWKLRHANMLQRRDAISWPIAVDDLEGTLHRALGASSGASAFLADASGDVVFRALWSNDEAALREALVAVRCGTRPPPARDVRVLPMLLGLSRYDEVVRAAGPRAIADLRREAPVLYGAAEVAWVWRSLTPVGRAALSLAAAATATAVVGGLRYASRRRFV